MCTCCIQRTLRVYCVQNPFSITYRPKWISYLYGESYKLRQVFSDTGQNNKWLLLYYASAKWSTQWSSELSVTTCILHHWVTTIPPCSVGLKMYAFSHRNQLSFSPPICAKSIWCTINLQVSMDKGHKGWFFCHIAIVLQIVTVFIAVPLAHVYFTIPSCSGFNSLTAT